MFAFLLAAVSLAEPSFGPGNLPPTDTLAEARLANVSWMQGHWSGNLGENRVEEHWSEPAGGQMMGMFRWLDGEQIQFYEFMTISESESGVELRIKHFNDDLSGWEEKDEYVTFNLTFANENRAAFLQEDTDPIQWIIYERTGEEMIAYFLNEDQEEAGEWFRFQLIGLGAEKRSRSSNEAVS